MTTFSMMPENDRREAGRFWLEALAPYHVEDVRKAFVEFARTQSGYPNPQRIIAIIDEWRKEVARQIAQADRDAQEEYERRRHQERMKEMLPAEERQRQADELLKGFAIGKKF